MKKVEACSQQGIYRPVLDGEKIRVAFLFQVPSQWPAWESLYRGMLRDSRFMVKLFLVKDSVDKSRQQDTAQSFLEKNSIEYLMFEDKQFELFAPHIALLQTPYDYVMREPHLYSRRLKQNGIRIVYVPYGIEISDTRSSRHDHFRRTLIRNAWRIYTLSDEFKREYEKYCENFRAVRGFGLPRFDMLHRRDRFVLPKCIERMANGRKIVVWHAHFAKRIIVDGKKKQVTPYLEEYISFANTVSNYSKDLFFCFIHHPLFSDMNDDGENNKKSKKLIKILNMKENAIVDIADDYRNVLMNADAVITDRSSLAVEAGILNVPVLYLENKDYREKLFPALVPLFENYVHGTSCDDMTKFTTRFMNNTLEKINIFPFPNFDGKCSERIIEDIISSINENPSDEMEEKFIFFGTGFIYRTMREVAKLPHKCRVIALSDNDSKKWGEKIDGITVIPPHEINELHFDKVIICVENVFEDEIEKQLLFDLEIPRNKIEHCDYLSILYRQ